MNERERREKEREWEVGQRVDCGKPGLIQWMIALKKVLKVGQARDWYIIGIKSMGLLSGMLGA